MADDQGSEFRSLRDAAGRGRDPRENLSNLLEKHSPLNIAFNDDGTIDLLLLGAATVRCTAWNADAGNEAALQCQGLIPSEHRSRASHLQLEARRVLVTDLEVFRTDTCRVMEWRAELSRAIPEQLHRSINLVKRLEELEEQNAAKAAIDYVAAEQRLRCGHCRKKWSLSEGIDCENCCQLADYDPYQIETTRIAFDIGTHGHVLLEPEQTIRVIPKNSDDFQAVVIYVDRSKGRIGVSCRTRARLSGGGSLRPFVNKQFFAKKREVLERLELDDPQIATLRTLWLDTSTVTAPDIGLQSTQPWLTAGIETNATQEKAIGLLSELSAGQAVLIQGPPGTGKTTVIVEAIRRRLKANPNQLLLITSHSNLAVQNALEGIVDALVEQPEIQPLLIAREERVPQKLSPFRCTSRDDERLETTNCYFATCATAALSEQTDMNFDVVILDEANKARIDDVLPVLSQGHAIALVGDHQQLPPVDDEFLQEVAAGDGKLRKLLNRSLFEAVWEGGLPQNAKCVLTLQHRMHPDIARYVSRTTYGGALVNGRKVKRYTYVGTWPLNKALHFIDTSTMQQGRELRGDHGATSNHAEARLVTRMVALLKKSCPQSSVAVIAMYSKQADVIRKELGRDLGKGVAVDTVDAFEGRQSDLVVVSLVRSNRRGEIGFLRQPNRLNVAVSRASRMLVCVGNARTLRKGDPKLFGGLIDAAREVRGYRGYKEINAAYYSVRQRRGQARANQTSVQTAGDTPHPAESRIRGLSRLSRDKVNNRGGGTRPVSTKV